MLLVFLWVDEYQCRIIVRDEFHEINRKADCSAMYVFKQAQEFKIIYTKSFTTLKFTDTKMRSWTGTAKNILV